MTDRGCWKCEYDWGAKVCIQSKLRETLLSVVFDCGAQRQFSRLRLTLLNAAPKHHNSWRITPCPTSFSVVTTHQDGPVTENDPSLPICHIVFMADRPSDRSQDGESKHCGELLLIDPESTVYSSDKLKLFEFDHPLTENTQSASFSITSSLRLSTMITRGYFVDPTSWNNPKVNRVVRVIPTTKRGTLSFPTDILLLIFQNLRSPGRLPSWRQDLLNCALVCREWTCALNVLLTDFCSDVNPGWLGPAPEITSFANALVARPSLCFDIKYLSAEYFGWNSTWNPFGENRTESRRLQFAKAFLSILRVAKNVRSVSTHPVHGIVVSQDDFADALSGHNKLDVFDGKCTLTMAEFMSCIAPCSSLKYLILRSILPPKAHSTPLPTPTFHLTELQLEYMHVKDDELVCLMNVSGLTLQRLILMRVSHLTNAGLCAALTAVRTSLIYLLISVDGLAREQGEEHALDVTIPHMERLTELKTMPEIASEQMVKRRAEAFSRCATTAPALPEVYLELLVTGAKQQGASIWGTARASPGWKIHEAWSQFWT